ncbi:MAG TPA: response regulator [Spirochaetia bacterium]|nr:response regulator [Spirochaetia bacterium]
MEAQKAIVCVDDEAIILMAMKAELARQFRGRFRVESALDARKALELIERLFSEGFSVAMVLTDWLMPGIKGDELVLLVKQDHPEVRCVLVSGQADAKAIAEARLESSLDAYIEKPWGVDRLLKVVKSCLDSPAAEEPPPGPEGGPPPAPRGQA